ncbi:MAG: hypothetical protein HC910_22060 [Spirulinaceae cyanobacterium SM2_1_0]|nr:hypothetical protein [Spirulinaceae cyanobacterium SM2_1_0]
MTNAETSITNLATEQGTQNGRLSSLEANTAGSSADIGVLRADVNSNDAEISALKTQDTVHSNQIAALQNDAANKATLSHTHALADITDSGEIAALNTGALFANDAGNLVIDWASFPTNSIPALSGEVLYNDAGTVRKTTIEFLLAQTLSPFAYRGTYNANTNTPTLSDVTGNEGDLYVVDTAGTIDLGSGDISLAEGDYLFHSGSAWQKGGSSAVGGVSSFNSRTGAITPAASDYDASQVDNDSSVSGTFVSDALDALKTLADANASATAALDSSDIDNASTITGATVTLALNALKTQQDINTNDVAINASNIAAATLTLATLADAEAGTDNSDYMSPLRTFQAIDTKTDDTKIATDSLWSSSKINAELGVISTRRNPQKLH